MAHEFITAVENVAVDCVFFHYGDLAGHESVNISALTLRADKTQFTSLTNVSLKRCSVSDHCCLEIS